MAGRFRGEPMTKILRFTSAPVGVLLVLLTVITMVSGVASVFYHYFPAIPTTATMTTTCAYDYPNYFQLVPDVSSVLEGSSGQVSFQCPATNPAFTVSGGVVSATPSFSFAAPYTTLWIYQWDGAVTTGACSGRTGARQIASGVSEVDIAPLSYNYCAEYVTVGSSGLPVVTLAWYKAGSLYLFSHYFPAIPTTSTMTTTCPYGQLIPNPSTVDQGSSGQVSFQCSATNPAFTISGGTFSATPYFEGTGFAAPYTTLWIYQSDGSTGSCSSRTGARQIETGVTEASIAPQSYNYCAEYASVGAGGLPAFYLQWQAT